MIIFKIINLKLIFFCQQLTPASARFGVLCANRIYETKLILKNEDVLAQRVVLKQPQTQYVKVFLSEMGAVKMK